MQVTRSTLSIHQQDDAKLAEWQARPNPAQLLYRNVYSYSTEMSTATLQKYVQLLYRNARHSLLCGISRYADTSYHARVLEGVLFRRNLVEMSMCEDVRTTTLQKCAVGPRRARI